MQNIYTQFPFYLPRFWDICLWRHQYSLKLTSTEDIVPVPSVDSEAVNDWQNNHTSFTWFSSLNWVHSDVMKLFKSYVFLFLRTFWRCCRQKQMQGYVNYVRTAHTITFISIVATKSTVFAWIDTTRGKKENICCCNFSIRSNTANNNPLQSGMHRSNLFSPNTSAQSVCWYQDQCSLFPNF